MGCSSCGRSLEFHIKSAEDCKISIIEPNKPNCLNINLWNKRTIQREARIPIGDAFLQGAGHCSSLAPLLAGKKEPGGNVQISDIHRYGLVSAYLILDTGYLIPRIFCKCCLCKNGI
jgi:hypothetical protein